MHALLRRARARLSFANVTSSLALFVALGGTSYAAVVLPANSVTDKAIRAGAVGSSEIKTGAVGRAEVRTGGITASEIRTDAVRGIEIRARAVGAAELQPDAVGADAIADGAVASAHVADGGIEAADLSAAARSALTDASAVTFRAAVSPTGALGGGNAATSVRSAAGVYAVGFGRDVSACQVSATLAAVRTGTTIDQPAAGLVTVGVDPASAAGLIVRTFDPAGVAADRPFHLLVAC